MHRLILIFMLTVIAVLCPSAAGAKVNVDNGIEYIFKISGVDTDKFTEDTYLLKIDAVDIINRLFEKKPEVPNSREWLYSMATADDMAGILNYCTGAGITVTRRGSLKFSEFCALLERYKPWIFEERHLAIEQGMIIGITKRKIHIESSNKRKVVSEALPQDTREPLRNGDAVNIYYGNDGEIKDIDRVTGYKVTNLTVRKINIYAFDDETGLLIVNTAEGLKEIYCSDGFKAYLNLNEIEKIDINLLGADKAAYIVSGSGYAGIERIFALFI